jgi:hypothetical protein
MTCRSELGAEQVDRLAQHALRGEVWDKAVTYCRQAGARAYDRAAFREAVASCEQAIQALAHLPEGSDTRGLALELRLAVDCPLATLGEHGRRLAMLGEAEALAKALDDRARLVQVLARRAQVLRQMGDPDGAIAAGWQALALALDLGDSVLQGQASYTLQVNYGAGSSITVSGQRYELVQFHFHKPSEEKINGKAFSMVAHFVHKNSEDKYAVVAVLTQNGKPNPFIQTLWSNLPKAKEKEHVVERVSINAATFLPHYRAYYTFPGSLTSPPCSEGVTWFVLKTPVEVSRAQVARFGKIYRQNARPVQPLNERGIRVSKSPSDTPRLPRKC